VCSRYHPHLRAHGPPWRVQSTHRMSKACAIGISTARTVAGSGHPASHNASGSSTHPAPQAVTSHRRGPAATTLDSHLVALREELGVLLVLIFTHARGEQVAHGSPLRLGDLRPHHSPGAHQNPRGQTAQRLRVSPRRAPRRAMPSIAAACPAAARTPPSRKGCGQAYFGNTQRGTVGLCRGLCDGAR
jgi:hypothetical protein